MKIYFCMAKRNKMFPFLKLGCTWLLLIWALGNYVKKGDFFFFSEMNK